MTLLIILGYSAIIPKNFCPEYSATLPADEEILLYVPAADT